MRPTISSTRRREAREANQLALQRKRKEKNNIDKADMLKELARASRQAEAEHAREYREMMARYDRENANQARRRAPQNAGPGPGRANSMELRRQKEINDAAQWKQLEQDEQKRDAVIRARVRAEYAHQNEMQKLFNANQARRRPPPNAGPGPGRANSVRLSPKQIMNKLRQKEINEAAQWKQLEQQQDKERDAIVQHVSRDQRNIQQFVDTIPVNQLPAATLPNAATLQIAHVVQNHLANAHTPREQQVALRNAQALSTHPNMGKFMRHALDYAALATMKWIHRRRVVPNFMNERHAMLRNPRTELLATIFLIALIILPRLYFFIKRRTQLIERQRNLTRQRR
jgi:hypothetical protein